MIYWPWTFAPADISPFVSSRNVRGASAISGASQTIGSGSQQWLIDYMSIPVTPEKVKLWRTLDARSQGMLNPLVIPVWEGDRIPKPAGNGFTSIDYWNSAGPYGSIPHSDGAFFGDGSGYYEPVNSATAADPIARGATTATFTSSNEIEPGTLFSIGVRLYVVADLLAVSGSNYSVSFNPPAREAVASGDYVNFDRPICKVRLASDNQMRLSLTWGRYGFGDLSFVEDLS